ncbi:Hypothetical protein NTJ_08775 [Nesidiocoris tenuis]|uniref:Uncharacterized protein n=1 Tax=Nesidiocoris tenuis TaxID=355587 RepID=A0ABN7AUU8_9HEMI|nr:Hypothetical protein NTJ_08775 [Nesidiocoris tenuis]
MAVSLADGGDGGRDGPEVVAMETGLIRPITTGPEKPPLFKLQHNSVTCYGTGKRTELAGIPRERERGENKVKCKKFQASNGEGNTRFGRRRQERAR